MIQIHSSNAVIIRFVATILTGKQMQFLVPVSFFNVSTHRATLTCITRINLNYSRLLLLSFIDKFLFKVIERPGYRYIPVFGAYSFCRFTNTRQLRTVRLLLQLLFPFERQNPGRRRDFVINIKYLSSSYKPHESQTE